MLNGQKIEITAAYRKRRVTTDVFTPNVPIVFLYGPTHSFGITTVRYLQVIPVRIETGSPPLFDDVKMEEGCDWADVFWSDTPSPERSVIHISIPSSMTLARAKRVHKDDIDLMLSPNSASPPYVFQRNGAFWQIIFEGREFPPIGHLAGMTYISALLSAAGRDVSALDLYETENPRPPETIKTHNNLGMGPEDLKSLGTGGTSQKVLEGKTPAELRKAKTALEEKISSDEVSEKQKEQIAEQIELIERALSNDRIADGATFEPKARKGARQTVASSINRAIKALNGLMDSGELAKHLEENVVKGASLRYVGKLDWKA